MASLGDALSSAIENNDANTLYSLIGDIPLNDLDPVEKMDILVFFLEEAVNEQNDDCVYAILRAFDEQDPKENNISTFTQLFMTFNAPDELLSHLVHICDERTFNQSFLELKTMKGDPSVITGLSRLEKAFSQTSGDLNYADLLLARDAVLDTDDHPALLNYIEDAMSERAPYAEIPVWVIQKDGAGNALPEWTHEQLLDTLPRVTVDPSPSLTEKQLDELAEEMLAEVPEDAFLDDGRREEMLEQIRDQLRYSGVVSEYSQRDETQKILEKANENPQLFRVLGPINYIPGAPLNGDDVCQRWGGCRMFTCNCFERTNERAGLSYHTYAPDLNADDEVDIEVDWFMLGCCHRCRNKIRSRAHAIRRPMPAGGWLGCYCSVECLRESLTADDIGIIPFLIRLVHDELIKRGIFNRKSENGPVVKEIVENRNVSSPPRKRASRKDGVVRATKISETPEEAVYEFLMDDEEDTYIADPELDWM